jgi:hypothetical protein
MFEFPSELTFFDIGEVEELPCGGKKKEILDSARGGFEVCGLVRTSGMV